jgi:hypothetical protein
LHAAPRDVGGEAAEHPGEDSQSDAALAGRAGPLVSDLVVEVGVDLLDAAAGDRGR